MKDHAAEAMPIAFLAMHEEKTEAHTEIIAVWEEVIILSPFLKSNFLFKIILILWRYSTYFASKSHLDSII